MQVKIFLKGKVMRKLFIFLSVLAIILIAFLDVKERFQQLDEISANTPSQVEMKQFINAPDKQMQNNHRSPLGRIDENLQPNSKSFQENRMPESIQQNQLNSIQRRRNSITNPIE